MAVLAALLIVALGFVIGQISYNEIRPQVATAATPSLLAYADETLWSAVPTTDTSWGDTNDNAE
jgi:hypothetical protein